MSIQALEERLRERPDDVASWFVYSDWLLEQGDARGELVRLEHRKASGARTPDEARALQAEIDALTEKHRRKWSLKGLPKGADVERRYGFVTGVQLQWADDTPDVLAALLAQPAARFVTSLRLRAEPDYDSEEWDGEPIEPESQIPAEALASLDLRRFTSLDLSYTAIGDEGAAALVRSERLGALRSLDLRYGNIGDKGVAALAGSPRLAGLATLRLQRNRITAKGAAALAKAKHLASLTSLDLRYNAIGASGAKALAASPLLRNLTALGLYSADVGGADGARALASSPHLPLPLRRYWKAR